MKKTYQIPTLIMMAVAQHNPIAVSPNATINTSESAAVDPGSFESKQRNDYNVWGDDWNK